MSAIVLLAVNDFPPRLGGEATLYHALARHLRPEEALVLAPRAPGDTSVDGGLAVPVVRRWLPDHGGVPRRLARSLLAGAYVAALLVTRRVRYIVCGQLLSLGAPIRLLAGLAGIPYAVIVHGADVADYHDRPIWGRMARWVVSGAEVVLANSGFTLGLLERLLPGAARRAIVLPLGVDPARPVDPARLAGLRERYRIGDGPVIMTVARLVPMKGQDVVIRALPRLLERFPGLTYLVVGQGEYREPLERLAREAGVASRVVFAGGVPAEELPAHYALGTLFVQLSRATGEYDGLEGFGLSLLEAASHGLPCIAGRSGGVPEAVEEGQSGLLIPPEDPEAFVRAAARLLADPVERSRMSGAARRWAAAHPWERSAACLRSLLEGA